ncbi:AI-2E family transporter, partial [Patescibacteria group bacterium]
MNLPNSLDSINVSTGTIIRFFLVLLFFAVLYIVRDLVLVVLTAIVIASSIEPVVKWCSKFRIPRLPAVIGVYVAIVLVALALFYYFVPTLVADVLVYLKELPQSVNISDLLGPLKESNFLSASQTVVGIPQEFSIKELVDNTQQILSNASQGFVKVAGTFFGGLVNFVLIMVISFYLAAQEDGVVNFLRIIVPVKNQKYILDLWKRSQTKIGYWMQGQFFLAFFIGLLVWLFLTIFVGIKYAFTLAVLAAVCEIIPIFGPIIAAIPGVLIAGGEGGTQMGVIVALIYLLIQQFENHLIYPMVVRKIVGVSPILVIVSLVIGLKLAGFLGVLLSVPLAAVFMEYIHDVE